MDGLHPVDVAHAATLKETELDELVELTGDGVERAVVTFLDFPIHVAVAPIVKPLGRAPHIFLLRDQASFGVALLVHGVVSGIYWTGTAAIGQMLYPQMKFAQFGAAGGLITAGFSMCLGPVLGLLLDALGNDYRYTFLAGSVLAFASVGLGWVVYRKWQQHGGQHHYVAPA
jgi:MFS family permease